MWKLVVGKFNAHFCTFLGIWKRIGEKKISNFFLEIQKIQNVLDIFKNDFLENEISQGGDIDVIRNKMKSSIRKI